VRLWQYSMQQLRRHTHLGTNTTNNNNDDIDIQYMDLKEPAQDNITKTVVQKQEYDAMLVAMDEYELEIERLENLNATLTANVQTLTSAALDGGGDTSEIDDSLTNRQRSISMDISPNEEYNNQEDDDMILTEDHYINKISKLQRQNVKKDKQMEHKKKLVSQLSMNLKTAAEKISEFGRERDEWKAKYEEAAKAQSTTTTQQNTNDEEESTKQIHNYQIQVIQNELSSLLNTIQTNNKSNSKHREHLLNEYRNDDTTILSMEKPEDTLKRVIRHLRNGDENEGDDDDSVTLEKSNKDEISDMTSTQQTGGGVNRWDSVTSIFGRGGSPSLQEVVSVDNVYGNSNDDEEQEEDIEPPTSEDSSTTNLHAPQSVEEDVETNTEEEKTISPQEYFIKSILKSRGYPGTTFSSLKCGYYNTPTVYQTASYGLALTKAIRSSDTYTVQSLLDAGLHPNACNEFGESILHAACRRGDYAMIQVLIEAHASVQVVDDFGRAPLHDAFWTASPNLNTIQLLMDQDPWLLCLMDSRGSTPLEYVRKEHWNIWIDFLRDTADRYWLNVNNDKRQDDDVVHPKEPPLAFVEPNSRPLSNPKEIDPTDLEPIKLIANGSITLQDLTKAEEEHDTVDDVSEDGDRVDTISNNETEKTEQEDVISAEGSIAEEVSSKDEQAEEQLKSDDIERQNVETISIDDTGDQSDSSTEEREDNLEDQIQVPISSLSVVDQQVDSDDSEKGEDINDSNTHGSEETDSAEKVTQHGTILLPQYAESHDAIESVYGVHTAYEDQTSQNEELEQDIEDDYETDDDNYIAKEPKDDNNSQEGEQLEEAVDEINSECKPSEVVESSSEDDLESNVDTSKYQEMEEPSETIEEINSEIPEPVSSCQGEQQLEEDETGNEASQACLVDDDETLNELSDIPTSINVLPKNHRSDVSTVMTSATAITDGTQARITAAGESKVLSKTIDKVKEQLDTGIDGDRSLGNYHSVVSQYTSSSKILLQDETLKSRLSRKHLYNRQGSLTTDDLLHVEDGAKDITSLGDRQVLVTSTDNEKYMVPRYKPPTMPPETNKDAMPFKKGLPDGYYTYKSSSGNDYSGQWKAGKRNGFGRAKYRQGEVYHGQWELGRRSGHGCLYLVNTDVYDGGWKLNKKHGLGVYYWADGEVDISWYEHDVRKESVRWTKDRRRAYALDLATSKKEQISLVRAANKIKEWEFKSQTL